MPHLPPPQPAGGPPAGPPGWSNAREHPDGTVVLVLGILGIVACGVLAPIAWVKGSRARREMAAHPEVSWTNQSAVNAGYVCGIVGTALIALVLVLIVMFLVAIAAAGS